MAIQIKLLATRDQPMLRHCAAGVFDHAIDEKLSAEFLDDLRHHVAVAIDGDTLVGMASAVHYVHPDKPPELWINEVGVAEAYRNQGIAKELLRALFDLARRLDCREAWVLTDRDNVPAMKLYTSTGGKPTDQVMFTFKLSPRDD